MKQITKKMLQGKIDLLNELTGNPLQQYSLVDGKYRSQIGNYHLSMENGGYALYRIVNEGGGINDIFSRGHGTKRELYERICAYILGIETKLNKGV
jgi:hypothetical protein